MDNKRVLAWYEYGERRLGSELSLIQIAVRCRCYPYAKVHFNVSIHSEYFCMWVLNTWHQNARN